MRGMDFKKELLILSTIGIYMGFVSVLGFSLPYITPYPISLVVSRAILLIIRMPVYWLVAFIIAWAYRKTWQKSFLYSIFVVVVAFATFYLLVPIPPFRPQCISWGAGIFKAYSNIYDLRLDVRGPLLSNLILISTSVIPATIVYWAYCVKTNVWKYIVIALSYFGFLNLFYLERWHTLIPTYIRAMQYEYVYIPIGRTFEAIFQLAIVTVVFWAILKTEQTKTPLKL